MDPITLYLDPKAEFSPNYNPNPIRFSTVTTPYPKNWPKMFLYQKRLFCHFVDPNFNHLNLLLSSVSDPYSSNPDTDPAKNLNPDPVPGRP